MIEYLVKSTICLIVFYFCYALFLSRTRQFQFNRYYLLFAVLFSLVFPNLHFTSGFSGVMEIPNKVILSQTVTAIKTASGLSISDLSPLDNKPEIFNLSSILFLIYSIISILLIIRFTRNFIQLAMHNSKYEKELYKGNKLFLINGKSNPYSFLNFIYVNRNDYRNGLIDKELLHHEIVHKSQFHSIDIILIEIIQLFFWFNPLIYLYKRAIQINHEYIADYHVLQEGISYKDYSHKLINYTFRNKCLNLASGFDYLLTKKRLIMISKNRIKRKWLVMSVFITCLITIVLSSLAFTSQQEIKQKGITFKNKSSHHEMSLNDSIIIASDFNASINNVHVKLPLVQFNKYNGTFKAGPFEGLIQNDFLKLTLTEDVQYVYSADDNLIKEKESLRLKGNAKLSFEGFEFEAKEIQIIH